MDQLELARQVLLSPQPSWIQAVGFKALISQPRESLSFDDYLAVWKNILAIDGLRVIRLRRDYFDSAISSSIARKTGKWISESTNEPIYLNPEEVAARIEEKRRRDERMDQLLQGHEFVLNVTFEGLINEREDICVRIQRYLGLTPVQLISPTRRQNGLPKPELICNWNELKGELKNE